MNSVNTIEVPPRAGALTQSMRGMGYTLQTAVADIIDNSIAAGAETICLRIDRTKEFTAYLTHDGVTYRKASLSTYSDGNKAMGSKPRTIFGEFIKGGLESAGVLRRGEPITDEVLEAYGRDSVTLTKLTNGEYVVTF